MVSWPICPVLPPKMPSTLKFTVQVCLRPHSIVLLGEWLAASCRRKPPLELWAVTERNNQEGASSSGFHCLLKNNLPSHNYQKSKSTLEKQPERFEAIQIKKAARVVSTSAGGKKKGKEHWRRINFSVEEMTQHFVQSQDSLRLTFFRVSHPLVGNSREGGVLLPLDRFLPS